MAQIDEHTVTLHGPGGAQAVVALLGATVVSFLGAGRHASASHGPPAAGPLKADIMIASHRISRRGQRGAPLQVDKVSPDRSESHPRGCVVLVFQLGTSHHPPHPTDITAFPIPPSPSPHLEHRARRSAHRLSLLWTSSQGAALPQAGPARLCQDQRVDLPERRRPRSRRLQCVPGIPLRSERRFTKLRRVASARGQLSSRTRRSRRSTSQTSSSGTP